jgi:hypothetical protein
MKKAKIIIYESIAISGHYRIILNVLEVSVSRKFPFGIKAKFLLLDDMGNFPRLLVDNHEPFGFHMHTQLPGDSNVRIKLTVKDYNEALELFYLEVERIVKNENI